MVKKVIATTDKPIVESLRPVSKGEKSFNALVTKIKERRAKLAEWEAYSGEFNRKYHGEFVPRRKKLDDISVQIVIRLDQSHDMKGLTKTDRQIIGELITYFADQVLMSVDDPVVAEIVGRYKPSEPTAAVKVEATVASAFKSAFDADSPKDDEGVSPEDLLRQIQAQLDQQERREQRERQAREDAQAKRNKARVRKATEERARVEEADVHVSLREVYRKLASALHPDREADPVERERKAALMQRVNLAYARRSLLDLLEIQLELEHIDQAALDRVNAERLNRWNAVLKEQLDGLDREIVDVERDLQRRCGLRTIGPTSPKIIKRALNEKLAHLNQFVQALESDLRVFDDINRLKPWLKEMKSLLQSDG
jgi:hypothetical protein